ncbi:MAG: hypothetical protein WCX81_07150 [Monoglobales bacterium]
MKRLKKSGDKNIFFIDGKSFSEQFGESGAITVDGVHPNDLGFAAMEKVIGDLLEKVLQGE